MTKIIMSVLLTLLAAVLFVPDVSAASMHPPLPRPPVWCAVDTVFDPGQNPGDGVPPWLDFGDIDFGDGFGDVDADGVFSDIKKGMFGQGMGESGFYACSVGYCGVAAGLSLAMGPAAFVGGCTSAAAICAIRHLTGQ